MNGFFARSETDSLSNPEGKKYTCFQCGLSKCSQNPKMKPFGNFKKGILNIGTFPSAKDDKEGKPWQDSSGQLLQQVYAKFGIDLFEDCLNINAIRCLPENHQVSNYQSLACRQSMMAIIKEEQPKVIITLGWEPIMNLLSNRWKKDLGTIEKWRGWNIPDRDFKAFICPTYHPDYVNKSKKKEIETIWINDLQNALKYATKPFPKFTKPIIDTIGDLTPLNGITSEVIAFDYETTGLKPHGKGHRIICASVADTPNHCFVFMMPSTQRERKPFIDLLKNFSIGKMAHNIKFEETWSKNRLKTPVENWQWDSMLAAHVLDNRSEITSLKFQTYVNFGIIDYASEITPYLKATIKGGNSINRIEELITTETGKDQLLKYCAMDSLFEYQLAMKQIDELGYDFLPF
jgi:uracil-DNA glycosylase family 4